jgi:hypothetical protein
MTNQNDLNQQDRIATYDSFMAMTKWGIALVVLALVLMAILLV